MLHAFAVQKCTGFNRSETAFQMVTGISTAEYYYLNSVTGYVITIVSASYFQPNSTFMKLYMPKPCHEDWEEMLPEEQGRLCLICNRTVVDFINWEPDAIKDYIIQRRGERVCGRFTVDQLDITEKAEELNWPALIRLSGLSFLKKVAAVIVVVFGVAVSSCNNKTGLSGSSGAADTIKKNVTEDSTTSGQKGIRMGKVAGKDSSQRIKNKKSK